MWKFLWMDVSIVMQWWITCLKESAVLDLSFLRADCQDTRTYLFGTRLCDPVRYYCYVMLWTVMLPFVNGHQLVTIANKGTALLTWNCSQQATSWRKHISSTATLRLELLNPHFHSHISHRCGGNIVIQWKGYDLQFIYYVCYKSVSLRMIKTPSFILHELI